MPLDNPQEVFYWVDEQDNVLGKISRKEAHSGTLKIHRTVGILVFDEDDQILLQQRSLKKDLDPGEWTISAGGHVTFGQEYDQAAKNELKEELGIKTKIEPIGKFLVTTPVQKEWVTMYRATVSHDQTFVPDSDEVEQVRWIKKDELSDFIRENPFSSWAKDLLERILHL